VDGISQPGVKGFTSTPTPGQDVLNAGIFLLKEDGDVKNASRPDWAKDGSFLAFRQLKQLVPEFKKFLTDNPVSVPSMNLTSEQGSALLGARMFGRWPSVCHSAPFCAINILKVSLGCSHCPCSFCRRPFPWKRQQPQQRLQLHYSY